MFSKFSCGENLFSSHLSIIVYALPHCQRIRAGIIIQCDNFTYDDCLSYRPNVTDFVFQISLDYRKVRTLGASYGVYFFFFRNCILYKHDLFIDSRRWLDQGHFPQVFGRTIAGWSAKSTDVVPTPVSSLNKVLIVNGL